MVKEKVSQFNVFVAPQHSVAINKAIEMPEKDVKVVEEKASDFLDGTENVVILAPNVVVIILPCLAKIGDEPYKFRVKLWALKNFRNGRRFVILFPGCSEPLRAEDKRVPLIS